jgi:hypothetical protein
LAPLFAREQQQSKGTHSEGAVRIDWSLCPQPFRGRIIFTHDSFWGKTSFFLSRGCKRKVFFLQATLGSKQATLPRLLSIESLGIEEGCAVFSPF